MRYLFLVINLLLVHLLSAQEDTLQSVNLDAITVRESRLEFPLNQTMHAITRINGDVIRKMNVQSIQQVLQYAGGVDLRQQGVHGIQGDVSIRGGTFDQVLVLLDGIPLNDPQTGHHLLNLPVPLEWIDHIEILKGPAARRYGPNAFTGAIQIITREDVPRTLNLGVMGGAYGTGEASASVALPGDKMNQWISFSRGWSEGYRHNTDYNLTNLYYKGRAQLDRHSIEFLAAHSDRSFGANGFYASPDFTEQFESIQTSIVGVKANLVQNRWLWKPQLSWRRNQDEYIFVRSNPSLYRNLHISQVMTAEFNGTGAYRWGQLGAGVALQGASLHSNNLGSRQRTITSGYLEYRSEWWNKLILNGGLSAHYYSDWGLQLFPGMDAGWRLGNHFRLFGTIGSTWRAPTFTDLYYEDQANVGNPDLQPESALTYEGGLYWMPSHTSLRVGYFVRDGKDLIDWTKPESSAPWHPDNLGSVTYRGWELEYQWWSTLPWLNYFYSSYNYISGTNHVPEGQFSRYALDHLRHQVQFQMQFQFGRRWNATWSYRYLDRVNLDDYQLVDLRAGMQWDRFEWYLQLDNLFNTSYTETNLVPMPGRWLQAGLRFHLPYR